VGARFSAPIQTGPGAHPTSYTMCTGSFSGIKRPGRSVDHPPPSSAEDKERVGLYFYSPSGPSWPVIGRPLPLLYFTVITFILLIAAYKNKNVTIVALSWQQLSREPTTTQPCATVSLLLCVSFSLQPLHALPPTVYNFSI
jgi:hypothetical protein